MRSRPAITVSAAVVVLAVFTAGFIVGQQYVVVRPSASPEPTIEPTSTPTPTLVVTSPSPSPSPTASPTASPTSPPATLQPTPEPTPSTVAGDRMIPFYFEIRPMFSA